MRPERRPDRETAGTDPPGAWSPCPMRKMSHHQTTLANASPWSSQRHAPIAREPGDVVEDIGPLFEVERPLEPFPKAERIPTDRWLMLDRLMGRED